MPGKTGSRSSNTPNSTGKDKQLNDTGRDVRPDEET